MKRGDPTGGQAYPRELGADPGMTLRDYFAGQALVGLLSGQSPIPQNLVEVAHLVYSLADEMIKVGNESRSQPPPG